MSMQTRPQALGALVVVGLGMLLIAGLSGVVLWVVTRQRVAMHRGATERVMSETAEA